MENSTTNGSIITYQGPGFGTHKPLAHRSEVIDRLSRTPVKVRHWLMTHETFLAGLASLDPANPNWVRDEKVRALIKNGLIRMVESASEFAIAFPDAEISTL